MKLVSPSLKSLDGLRKAESNNDEYVGASKPSKQIQWSPESPYFDLFPRPRCGGTLKRSGIIANIGGVGLDTVMLPSSL
jgi:hypothetical protein